MQRRPWSPRYFCIFCATISLFNQIARGTSFGSSVHSKARRKISQRWLSHYYCLEALHRQHVRAVTSDIYYYYAVPHLLINQTTICHHRQSKSTPIRHSTLQSKYCTGHIRSWLFVVCPLYAQGRNTNHYYNSSNSSISILLLDEPTSCRVTTEQSMTPCTTTTTQNRAQ